MKAERTWRLLALIMLIPLGLLGQNSSHDFEHNAEVKDAQYNADGKFIVTVSVNGIVKLWEAESGTFIRSFSYAGPWLPNFRAEFSLDGKAIAVVNGRGGKVWNTKFGDVICSLFGFSDDITAVHFSHNSKWLVASSKDGTAILYNVETGAHHHTLSHMVESLGKTGGKYGITEARFCSDDHTIITGSGEELKESHVSMIDSISGATYPMKYDSSLLLWDVKTGKVVSKLTGYPFDVYHDGSRIVTGTVNVDHNVAKVWDAATGKPVHLLSGQPGKIDACEFSADGKSIITVSSEEGSVRLWDSHTGKLHGSVSIMPHGLARLSPHGNLISVHSADTTRMYESHSGKLLYATPSHHPSVFSPDGREIVTFSGNHVVVIEAETGERVTIGKDGKSNRQIVKVVK